MVEVKLPSLEHLVVWLEGMVEAIGEREAARVLGNALPRIRRGYEHPTPQVEERLRRLDDIVREYAEDQSSAAAGD